MGRTILVDDSIEDYISKLQNDSVPKMGLIIGQNTNQKDYVTSLSITPDDEANGADIVSKAARMPGKEFGRNQPIDITKVDTQWLSTHALQVNRMLVGGIDVIGVFFVGDLSLLNQNSDKLKQTLYTVSSKLRKFVDYPPSYTPTNSRILLFIDTISNKCICRTYDFTNNRDTGLPGDWKYQILRDKWYRLNTQLALNIDDVFDKTYSDQVIHKNIQAVLAPFFQQLLLSSAAINGEVIEQPDALLSTKYKLRSLTPESLSIDLYSDKTTDTTNPEPPVDTECHSKMSVYGSITGRAYVHSKASFIDAVNAIKMDLVRSLHARCELLCEDIEITEGDTAYTQCYTPPTRVFACVPSNPITFSDYVFVDEEPEEVSERLSELLDVIVPLPSLELCCEKYPDNFSVCLPKDVAISDCNTIVSGHSLVSSHQPSINSDQSDPSFRLPVPPQRLNSTLKEAFNANNVNLPYIVAAIVVTIAIILYLVWTS